jgi:DNA-binding transcriptional ArsR family regulator
MNDDKCGARVIHQDKLEEARKSCLRSHEIEKLSQLFKAIGDPSRIRILSALKNIEMCVCDLAVLLDISESAVSHQLRLLRNMDLVANRRDGTVLYYSLSDEHVVELLEIGLVHTREVK